ncbi:MAG: leucyl/phenylalanyl-tRNA--protein transferase [Acidimicrobiales bacterium]
MDQEAAPCIEPPATQWHFPPPDSGTPSDLVAVGADLEPGTLLPAYRSGYFPMPVDRAEAVGWWSPDPRGVIELGDLAVSRSLRRSMRRYEVRVDTAFEAVITACADPGREHGWISGAIERAYIDLHNRGWVHSVEAWDDEGLAGGLYGVSIGNFFAGESMFHVRTDASKAALVALVDLLGENPGGFIDVQWITPHLESLGATDLPRERYLERLHASIELPGPDWSA